MAIRQGARSCGNIESARSGKDNWIHSHSGLDLLAHLVCEDYLFMVRKRPALHNGALSVGETPYVHRSDTVGIPGRMLAVQFVDHSSLTGNYVRYLFLYGPKRGSHDESSLRREVPKLCRPYRPALPPVLQVISRLVQMKKSRD